MDIGSMMALGLFDSEEKSENKGGKIMTDLQFKGFIRMCLTVSEATREVKDFKKLMGSSTEWAAHGNYGAFAIMISKIADATGDMEKVKQILQDILKMEGAGRQ